MSQYCAGRVLHAGKDRGLYSFLERLGSSLRSAGACPLLGRERGTSPRTTFWLCTPHTQSSVGQHCGKGPHRRPAMRLLTYREAIAEGLVQAMETDPHVFV